MNTVRRTRRGSPYFLVNAIPTAAPTWSLKYDRVTFIRWLGGVEEARALVDAGEAQWDRTLLDEEK